MDYQPDIRLVYTHSKGDGCHNDGYFVTSELFLDFPTDGVIQPGVVG